MIFGDYTAKGFWSKLEGTLHINFLELKAVLLALTKTVRAFVLGSDHSGLHRQHNCGFLHQQGGRYEIRLSLCPPMETPVLV